MTRRAYVAVAVTPTVAALVLLPPPLFAIGAVVVLLVASLVAAAHYYDRALMAETGLRMADYRIEAARIDLAHMTEDYDGAIQRLGEVLDEHALCPAPVLTGVRSITDDHDHDCSLFTCWREEQR